MWEQMWLRKRFKYDLVSSLTSLLIIRKVSLTQTQNNLFCFSKSILINLYYSFLLMHLHFAGGSKRAIVPPTGKTGNDQRETGVSLLLQLKYWNLWQPFYGMLSKCLTSTCNVNSCRFQKDPTWSETGDRYLLKLFRDHLFHQVTEAGTPWIDLSHIVSCLNKVSLFSLCISVYKP